MGWGLGGGGWGETSPFEFLRVPLETARRKRNPVQAQGEFQADTPLNGTETELDKWYSGSF